MRCEMRALALGLVEITPNRALMKAETFPSAIVFL